MSLATPSAQSSSSAHAGASSDVEARVQNLLRRMTLEEKVRQMTMGPFASCLEDGRVSRRAMTDAYGNIAIGAISDPMLSPRQAADATNAAQRYFVEETRLGIPALVIGECLHGHMAPEATVFPQAIAQASTWNRQLVERMAAAIAREARAVGVVQALAPVLDLARDPRWGRVQETFGEDPYLTSEIGLAYLRGAQGVTFPLDGEHVLCTVKHFAAHGSPEGGINLAPVSCGERQMRELFLPPFHAAVTQGHVASVMTAYSECDGTPATASRWLLSQILRQEWGFSGYVISDYDAIKMLHTLHRTAADAREAGRQAVTAGVDLEAPTPYGFDRVLMDMVARGEIPESLIDAAVARILRTKFLAGLFENPYVDPRRPSMVVNCPEHQELALDVARQSIVLLKNEGDLLPLDPAIQSIAVIGPNAAAAQLGDYAIPKPQAVTVLEGVRSVVSDQTAVHYARGCGLYEFDRSGMDEAVAAAKRSDVAVVVVGDTSHFHGGVGWGEDHGCALCGEGFDVSDLDLPGLQGDLVRAVYNTGTPTVVVLMHGRPHAITWIAQHVPAILEAWYPGEQGGLAVAEVLFGKINPSGKLPVSIPRSAGHIPACYNHKPSARGAYYRQAGSPGAPGRDYVFSEPTPLFRFGHGLSYTTFEYRSLRIAPRVIRADEILHISVEVINRGKRPGSEVVQLYITDLVSSVTTPVESLKGFEKIHLAPGEAKEVSFTIRPDDLSLFNAEMKQVVEPGEFKARVGPLTETFTVA